MKKLFFIAFIYLCSQTVNAQVFSVGDTTCNYYPVHNVLYCYQTGIGAWNMTKSHNIDLDADMIDDISLINAHNGSSPGSGSHQHGVFTCTSTTGVEFAYSNSAVPCYTNIISNLSYGTTLTSSLNWSLSVTNPQLFDFDRYMYFLTSYYCGYVSQFGGANVYVGFRKILTGDTIYGWIKIKTTITGADEIVSYAYKHTASNNTVTPVFTNTLASIICEGSTFTLTASPSGGNFYGAGVTGNLFNSGITGGGTHYVWYNLGCATAVLNVSVTAAPVLAFTNPLNSVCLGDSIVLTASPSGGSFTGPGVSGNVFHSSVTGAGTKTVSYSYTDGNGCSNTKTTTINVLTAPSVTVTSTAPVSCPGTPITLTANGASSFTWSTGSNAQSIVVSPTASIVYTITGAFSSSACPGSSSTTFTQSVKIPTVTAGTTFTNMCSGTSAYITAYGASTYSWNTGALTNIINVTPTVTTTYSVVGFNYGGCGDTAQITMNVIPNATIAAVPNKTSICIGDTVIISLSGGNANSYYLYNPSSGYMSVSGTTTAITPTATTNYTVISNCAADVYFSVIVTYAPSLTVTSVAPISCPGASVTLTASGASSYTWSTGATTSSIVVSPTAGVVYTVTGVNSTCPNGATKTFTQSVSTPTVLAWAVPYICLGNSATLTAVGATSYSWSSGGLTNTINVTPTVTTTFSVIGSNYGGCSDTAYVGMTVMPYASISAVSNQSTICSGDTAWISLSGYAGYYQIYSSSFYQSVVGPTVVPISPTVTTSYTVSSSALCYNPAYVTQNVDACVGIKEIGKYKSHFQIFPNPNNGEFEIKGTKEEMIFISNELGQMISTKNLIKENNYSVKINDLQNGVYFVGNKSSRQKIVVIK